MHESCAKNMTLEGRPCGLKLCAGVGKSRQTRILSIPGFIILLGHFQFYQVSIFVYLSFRWLQGCLVAELEPKIEPSPVI